MRAKTLPLLVALILSACAPAPVPAPTVIPITGRDTCPVTRPPEPAFKPPDAYPARPLGDYFYFGDSDLWTALPSDGVWEQLPQEASGYNQKLPWWHAGYDPEAEPFPELTLTGRRLDGQATALKSERATNASSADLGQAMMTGFVIPSSGCWEITGSYKGARLTFVVWVQGV